MTTARLLKALTLPFIIVLFLLFPKSALATHSWGNFHWPRSSNPLVLNLGDNVNPAWDSYLATASTDWSASSVLNTNVVLGGANPKNCRPTNGRVEVCNSKYGRTGWLGIAQIWTNGEHIGQAVTKLNDTYFNSPTYNTPGWRAMVMCQEVGHTFGLDHQDEDFNNANLGTCMDYTSDPLGPPSNEHPNAHDYEELETIYAHLDGAGVFASLPANSGQAAFDEPGQWGREIKNNGRVATFERELGFRRKLTTFVIFAEE